MIFIIFMIVYYLKFLHKNLLFLRITTNNSHIKNGKDNLKKYFLLIYKQPILAWLFLIDEKYKTSTFVILTFQPLHNISFLFFHSLKSLLAQNTLGKPIHDSTFKNFSEN